MRPRRVGLIAGFAASGIPVFVLDPAKVTGVVPLCAIVALLLVGYLAGRVVESVERVAAAVELIATAQETQAYAATLPWALASGQITMADLVAVEVPDAPPEDMA